MLFGPARMSQSSLIRLLGLLLVWMSTLACATPISVVDGIGEGGLVFGAEELITDWASLATEHNSDLPPAFTICSSVSVNNKTTVLEQNFWQLLSKNGSGGIYASITGSLESEKVQTVRLGVDTKLTSFTNHSLLKLPMQVYWYHSCTGMDMVSGHVQMIINGQLIVDQVVKELTGYAEVRPRSLQGNLLLGKESMGGFWYQGRQRISNVNIYGGILSKDEMKEKTFGSECGLSDGDFLSWEEMEWTLHGLSLTVTIDKEDLCKKYSNIILFTAPFLEQDFCREHCLKISRGWMAPVSTKDDGDRLLQQMTEVNWRIDATFHVMQVMVDPQTGNVYEGMDGLAAWLPITDAAEEGIWLDKRTGESPEEPMWLREEPAGETSKNCAFMLVTWRGWTAWSCVVPKSEPMNCPCLFPQMPYLTMRGLCKDSKLERVYIPQNYHANGQMMYYGILKSRIEYGDEGWRLRTGDNTTAVSKARKVSFLLGKSEWVVTGESSECSGGSSSFSLQLKLTGCRLKAMIKLMSWCGP